MGFNLFEGAALASALAAAAACVVLCVALRRLCGCPASALLAAGSLGVAPAFWAQAVIPEVYALNVLLLAACVALAERATATGAPRYLVALAFAGGLGLANHWPLFVLAAPAIAILLLLRPRLYAKLAAPKVALACALALCCGLLPYLHLVTVDPTSFLFKADYQSSQFFDYIRRFGYKDPDIDLTVGARAYGMLVPLGWIVVEHGYLLGLIAVGGLGLLLRARSWALAGVALWGMLSTTALLSLVSLHDFHDRYSVAVFAAYPLPAYMFATIPLAFGLAQLYTAMRLQPKWRLALAAIALSCLAGLRFAGQDRSGEDFVAGHARQVLASLEPGSLLLLDSSDARVPLKLFDYFEGDGSIAIAQDIDYFYDYANREAMGVDASLAKLAAEAAPVASIMEISLPNLGQRFLGTHYVIDRAVAAGEFVVELDAGARAVIDNLIAAAAGRQRNFHSAKFLEDALIVATARLLGASRESELAPEDNELLARLLATTAGSYALVYELARDPATPATILGEAVAALEPRLGRLTDSRRAAVFALVGEWHLERNDITGALVNFENAVAVYPSVYNQRSIKALLLAYARAGQADKYARLRAAGPRPKLDARIEEADAWCASSLGRSCR